jgi:glycosyltransferase involved in cell wall biosynthesis
MPRISVVIPVYNSAKFLRECIESLLIQTEGDCEFIFVNDGSKDNSRDIIASYQENDSRIEIISQENQGVSVARNVGIAAAKSEFVAFVDADDTIAPEMLDTLYRIATETGSDIVCSGFIYEQDGHTLRLDMPFEKDVRFGPDFIAAEVIPYMLRYDSLNSVANKMYAARSSLTITLFFPKDKLSAKMRFLISRHFAGRTKSSLPIMQVTFTVKSQAVQRGISLKKTILKLRLKYMHLITGP